MMTAAVTGGSRGLGLAIVQAMRENGMDVVSLDVVEPDPEERINWFYCDVTDPDSIRRATEGTGSLDVLVNNAGVNDISFFEDLSPDLWDRVMNVNTKGIFNVSQALFAALRDAQGTICNITSNAAWVPMTSSLAYNASKAAAHMMTVQMAHEFHRRDIPITVFGVAPGKLAGTPMSGYIEGRVLETRGWTPEYAREYQLASLRAGAETKPEQLAQFIAWLLDWKDRHSQLAGCILPYGA